MSDVSVHLGNFFEICVHLRKSGAVLEETFSKMLHHALLFLLMGPTKCHKMKKSSSLKLKDYMFPCDIIYTKLQRSSTPHTKNLKQFLYEMKIAACNLNENTIERFVQIIDIFHFEKVM